MHFEEASLYHTLLCAQWAYKVCHKAAKRLATETVAIALHLCARCAFCIKWLTYVGLSLRADWRLPKSPRVFLNHTSWPATPACGCSKAAAALVLFSRRIHCELSEALEPRRLCGINKVVWIQIKWVHTHTHTHIAVTGSYLGYLKNE